MSRIETREHVLMFLFQAYFRTDPVAGQLEMFKEDYPDVTQDPVYFTDMVYGVINKRQEIDEKIIPFLNKWKIDRIPVADRIILEIAAYEILFMDDVPVKVSINEAVKLAKKYGTDNSSSYINGVLSSFEKSL
ncbi:MAG: transcription antitermination factor NusB [Saccharofermentans sp.]|nr:transcription antitermination factor NusB [Saccharofermentans sp.]